MKKLFTLTIIFALVLVGCDDETISDNKEKTTLTIKNESSKILTNVLWNNIVFDISNNNKNSDIIGGWNGNKINTTVSNTIVQTISLDINNNSWFLSFTQISMAPNDYKTHSENGSWERSSNTIKLISSTNSHEGTVSGNKLILKINVSHTTDWWKGTWELTKSSVEETINIKPGTSVTKIVESGVGYIFFNIGATSYRTKDLVFIENKGNKNFIFIDNTLIVDITMPEDIKTLASL